MSISISLSIHLVLGVLLGTFVLPEAEGACSDYKDCYSCTTGSSWFSTCNWCARAPDSSGDYCHESGSLVNPCRLYEDITNSTYCKCVPSGCVPQIGYNSSVCSWYVNGNIDQPGPNPALWQGGEFLPSGYRSAAACACSGGGNALWKLPVASCVRTHLLDAHKALNVTTKQAMRQATLSWDPFSTYKYVDLIYQMHVLAYRSCCCSGRVAPLPTWYGVFFAGKILPCWLDSPGVGVDIISSILQFGRCGCGW
eukprot:TRINITY_DN11503_c0_g1_i1.p1 TRINITY_DN11503_c0_g1~~TRINITY_DN11503_c0_g1_i1.p1  ORF type:complete len:253 (-),score=-1.56 TRINITY_DN11503_c0_g1_i1:93-851(-)